MKYLKLLIWLTVFAVSMALLESAVVIYIRELLYPEGFQFPLMTLESRLAITEILREIATILMLMAVGILSGRTFAERFAIFIYSDRKSVV